MERSLRQAKQETTKAVPPKAPWYSLAPTEEQQGNIEKALLRWVLENGGQRAKLKRSIIQAGKILKYLAELSPEWQGLDPKTLSRKANPQHQALFRTIDKYAKKVPS